VTVTDRYLDSEQDGGRLAAALVRARLRQSGGAVVVTVKRAGAVRAGVTTRVELEAPATRSLDPGRWPDSDARRVLVDASGGLPLREIGVLRQRRLTRLVRRGGTTVELSLDTVDALVDGRLAARRHELEAELVRGDEAALAELGSALAKLDGVGPPAGSKLRFAIEARALAVRGGPPLSVPGVHGTLTGRC
jgi:inorganic triphosphatase YgiF